jgi:quercetin dioxygenase-like cupin family protein
MNKKYFHGKVKDFVKRKGWFIGHFMDEKQLVTDKVEVAWQDISNKKADPTDTHYHTRSLEINIVISGQVKFKIDGEVEVVHKGEFYIIYPQTVVEEVSAGDKTEIIVIRAPSINDKVQI